MDRDTFRLVAAGQFAYCISADMASVDVGQMRTYIDGAMFAFDKLTKQHGTYTAQIIPVYTKVKSRMLSETEANEFKELYGNALD